MWIPLWLSAEALGSKVVVNELYRSGNLGATGDEWIELVLLETLTDGELEAFFTGDSTLSTASKFSGYGLQAMVDFAAVFPAGTVIVLTGGAGAPADLTYDPATGDWNLVLTTADAHVVGNGSVGDLGPTDVAYVDVDGTNGGQTLSADGFAVTWDGTPGTFGALASVTIGAPTNGTGAVVADDPANATGQSAWTVSVAQGSLTPGAPNGGANTTAIDLLRAAAGCPDADGDGVCDAEDACAGGDDDEDLDDDGIPDACDGLSLAAGPVTVASQFPVAATGANPGERVYFYASPGPVGVGPCPAAWGGLCFDLGPPAPLLGSAVADATGTATRTVALSFGTTVGATVTVQAGVKRGAASIKSDPAVETVVPDVCGTGGVHDDLQDAIDAAAVRDTLHVCAGTWGGVLIDQDLTLVGIDGAAATTIESPVTNAVRVTGGDVAIDGFTIRSTAATAAGLRQTGGTTTLTNLVFSGNTGDIALRVGGTGSTTVDGCTFDENDDLVYVVLLEGPGPNLVRHSTFTGNDNALHVFYSFITPLEASNNLFATNTTTSSTLYVYRGSPLFFNNVMWNNTVTNANAYVLHIAEGAAVNNIVSENTTTSWVVQSDVGYPSSVGYTDDWANVPGGIAGGTNTLTVDPMFVDAANGDFHLDPASGCIDAGDPLSLWDDVDGSRADLGLYGGPYGE